MNDSNWAGDLAEALIALGLEELEATQLATESVAESREAQQPPGELYGPATVYARSLVDAVHRPSQEWTEETAQVRHIGPVLLSLRGVGKRYRRREVFSSVDLTVRSGEVAAIVGANGSGKSTLLRICAGTTRASSGDVRRTGRVGYVPQDGGVVGLLTPFEHFELFGAAAGVDRRRARSTGEHLATRLSWRPNSATVAERLSGGTRQKLNLVLGELHAPDLLLLDEPYQGFDAGSYVDFWDQIYTWRDAGKGIVVVTHLLHELDRVDHIVDLGSGAD